MTPEEELQKLIYDRLTAYASLTALVSTRIYDIPPQNTAFPYVSFGPSSQIEDDAECIIGSEHTFQIDVWSRYQGGYLECKQITGQIKKALHLFAGSMTDNALVELRVESVRHMRDPDGMTSHGVVILQAIIEEA